jgi:hypothetical protein
VLRVLEPLIDKYCTEGVNIVHDPFAGTGERLAKLVEGRFLYFSGTDIEEWKGRVPQVRLGNSKYKSTYPSKPFIIVTSPTYYNNRISTDYADGPTENTKRAGRHAYGISLGHALDPDNMARVCRPTRGSEHDAMALACMRWWPERALVNVDAPIADRWVRLGWEAGYITTQRIPAMTRRLKGGLAGAERRATNEVVLVMHRRRVE